RRFDPDREPDRSVAEAMAANARTLRASDRALAKRFVEGFHSADVSRMSERALADNGSPGEDVREMRIGRLLAGYVSLVDALAEPVRSRIQTGTVVSAVRWREGRVEVEARDHAGASLAPVVARSIVVTVPLGNLSAPGTLGAIELDPPVATAERAIAKMTMGNVVKLVLQLDRDFWTDEQFAERVGALSVDQMSFLQTSERVAFPVWWTSYPVRAPVLVAWAGGPPALELSRCSVEELEALAIESLATMLALKPRTVRDRVRATFYHDWINDPFARGVYSYALVGGHRASVQLAKPARKTVWFAGEAADRVGRTGTVHGAIASGWRAADEILDD
ncbi:MAG: flavin monoamine oxidase family protein, partial [Solirubrobacteraceae bacterium]